MPLFARLDRFLAAAKEIAESGTFTRLARATPFNEINEAFPR